MAAVAASLQRALHPLARIASVSAVTPRRLRLIGVALASLTLGLAGLIRWDLNRRSLEVATGEIRALDLALAEETSRHLQVINQMLQRAENRVEALRVETQAAFRQRLREPDIRDFMAGLLAALPSAHGIALVGTDGRFLAGGRRDTSDFSIADRPYFQNLRDHANAGLAMEIVERNLDDGRRSIILARRIDAPDGMFLGVALLVVDVDYLLNFYDVLNRQQRIAVTLLRPDGLVLIHYPPDEPGPALVPAGSPWHGVVAGGGGSYRSPGYPKGRKALVAAQPLPDFPLVLDISMHEDDILASFRGQTHAILGIGALLSLTTLLLFWLLARQIQRRDEQTQALVRSADALKASENRLRDLAEMASDWFWEQDAALRLSWVSLTAEGLHHHAPARLGQQRWDYIDSCLEPQGREAHRQDLLARRAFRDFRYQQASPDGSTRYFSISGWPRFDEAGMFLGYRGIGRHITAQIEMEKERDRALEQAERAEALLRDALDSLSESIVICDDQDRFVMTNEGYRQRYPARAKSAHLGRTFEENARAWIAAGEYPDAVGNEEAWLAKRLHHHRTAAGGFERQLSDGSWTWVTERRMRSGGTVTLHVDITQMKRTEIALRRSEERLDLAQSVAGIGSWELDLATDTWFWSRQMYRIRGLDPDCHTPYDGVAPDRIHPEDLAKIRAWLADLRHGIKREPKDLPITRPDGVRRLLRVEGQAITDEQGVVTRIAGTSRDITERKQIEQQLAHAQKMEALGTLTGGMAHDFNNVLSVVINNLELAQQELSAEDRTQEWLRDALDAALRGADLTQSLLAFARRQPLKFEPLNLNDVVMGMQRLLSRVLGENIVIGLELADALWPVVSDRAQTEASITNLATNARDAMPRGGNLTITTENRTLQADDISETPSAQPGEYCVITIADTGDGMPSEVATRIFEPFFTTKSSAGGTGLGLSMVFGFMKQVGGQVSVQSEPGMGTRISLFLPRARTEIMAPDKGPPGAMAGRNEIVLVVEDNALLRRVVTRQISGLGYRVLEAADAAAALAILRATEVDLLFTDVVMPGRMDGIELARQAQAQWPRLRVQLTSGFTGRTEERGTDGLSDAPAMLRKPYRREALAQALRTALSNESNHHPHAA